MAVDFICPTCNGTRRVGDEFAGRVIRCGACRTMLRVPGQAVAPPPAPVAAVPVARPRARPIVPAPPPAPDELEPLDAELLPDTEPDAPAPTEPRDPEAEFAAAIRAIADKLPDATPSDPAPPDAPPAPIDRRWDEDDRPRRDRTRRRRPPPPPPGRGVLFWLLMTGGVFVLLTVGCCGGLYWLIPGPKWQTHESARGGFRVELPAPPRADMDQIAGEKPDPAAPMEGTVLFGRMEEFAIVYRDIPAHEMQFTTTKQLLDAAVQGMRESGEVQSVLHQKDITVGGYPAREVEFSAKGSGWYASRIIVAHSRLYVLVAGGRFAKPGNENAKRFLESFELTDPKLKAEAQRKADEERRVAEQAARQREQDERWKAKQESERLAREEAERLRRQFEERLRAEKAEAERLRRERVRLANDEFLKTAHTGPAVPEVAPAPTCTRSPSTTPTSEPAAPAPGSRSCTQATAPTPFTPRGAMRRSGGRFGRAAGTR